MSDTTDLHVRPHGDGEHWHLVLGEEIIASYFERTVVEEVIKRWLARRANGETDAQIRAGGGCRDPTKPPPPRPLVVGIGGPAASAAAVAALRAEVKALREGRKRVPRSRPLPRPETVIAAYKAAKEARCDNREDQDEFVENIQGPLPAKMKENARRAAGVGGIPGPKPGTRRKP
jgi:hypothetical protein